MVVTGGTAGCQKCVRNREVILSRLSGIRSVHQSHICHIAAADQGHFFKHPGMRGLPRRSQCLRNGRGVPSTARQARLIAACGSREAQPSLDKLTNREPKGDPYISGMLRSFQWGILCGATVVGLHRMVIAACKSNLLYLNGGLDWRV